MNLFPKQKETHRHQKTNQGEKRGGGKNKLGG